MRRARPYRGENPEPGKDVHGELDLRPGIREQPRPGRDICSNAGDGTAVHLSAPRAVRHDVAHQVAHVVLQISDDVLDDVSNRDHTHDLARVQHW